MLPLLLATSATAVLSYVVLYRLYFHPLARYPGPWIGRATDWYTVYHSLKGDRYVDFVALHARYGDIVRYGPNRLSFSTVDALQAVYGTRANTKKSYWYDTMTFYMQTASTHATTNKVQHARKRRILAQALSDRMLHVYEDGFMKLLDGFVRRYEKPAAVTENGWSAVFDMEHEFMLLNFDSMGDFCFGESFGSLQNPSKADMIENSLEAFRGLNAIGHMPGLSWLQLDALASKVSRAIKEYEAYAAKLANKCVEKFGQKIHNKEQLSCVFDILYATSSQPGVEGFTFQELVSESSLLVTTGTDTTSGALANALFNLLNNPETMSRLTREIRDTFSDISEIRVGKPLNDCKYLAACIDETHRLTSIVGGCLMREVLPGGITIDGHFIPRGVDVGVPYHVIMRSSKYHAAPWEYRPQRWLHSETSAEEIRVARSAYCAFGLGPTGCVGKTWAMMEMKLTLAQLLFRYDLQMEMAKEEPTLSAIQRLHRRDENALDRFIVTNKGPYIRFRSATGT